MRRIAVAGIVGVVALGLVGCGELSVHRTGSPDAQEIAEARSAQTD